MNRSGHGPAVGPLWVNRVDFPMSALRPLMPQERRREHPTQGNLTPRPTRTPGHRFSPVGSSYAIVCTITGPARAVAGPASSGARFSSIHVSARLFDSPAPA